MRGARRKSGHFGSWPWQTSRSLDHLFKLEAWNVQRTNSQTKKPDNFTAKKYQSAV